MYYSNSLLYHLPETLRKADVLDLLCALKQWGDVFGFETGDAATYWGYQEMKLLMMLGIGDEIIHVWTDGFYAALHRWDGVTLTLQTNTLAHDGTEMQAGNAGCSTTMHASQIAAKHKYLVLF